MNNSTLQVPDLLFKYMTASTAKIVLETQKLRWSSPVLFNDPNEFRRMPVFAPTIEGDWNRYLQEMVELAYGESSRNIEQLSARTRRFLDQLMIIKKTTSSKKELLEIVQCECPTDQESMSVNLRAFTSMNRIESARVFCLTEDSANDAMWAHYSENHTGCVFGFKHLPDLDTPFMAARPVIYTDGMPVIGTGLDFLLYGQTEKLRADTFEAIFLSKDQRWSYEKEWRVLTWRYDETESEYGDYEFSGKELDSVTFGFRMAEETRRQLLDLLRQRSPDCSVFEMKYQNGQSFRCQVNG